MGSRRVVCVLCAIISQLIQFGMAEPNYDKRNSLRRLLDDIETKISPDVPPFRTELSEIEVEIRIGPFQVMDLDDANQRMSVRMYIMMIWAYEDLTWDSANYSGIYNVRIPQDKMWTPMISVVNQVDGTNFMESKVPLVLRKQGMVVWQTLMTSSIICKTDMSNYPFDTQTCYISFMAIDLDYTLKLNVAHNEDYDDIVYREHDGEWEFVRVGTQTIEKTHNFLITLRRKKEFFILNLIFPMALLSLVNSFVFLLPVSSGEKMSFLMAVFVSNTVFLTLIHDIMPSTSDSLSNLSLYLVLIQLQGFFAIIASIAVQNVHHHRKSVETRQGRRLVQVAPCDRENDNDLGSQNRVISSTEINQTVSVKGSSRSLEKNLDRVFFVIFLICAAVGFTYVFLRHTE